MKSIKITNQAKFKGAPGTNYSFGHSNIQNLEKILSQNNMRRSLSKNSAN